MPPAESLPTPLLIVVAASDPPATPREPEIRTAERAAKRLIEGGLDAVACRAERRLVRAALLAVQPDLCVVFGAQGEALVRALAPALEVRVLSDERALDDLVANALGAT